MGLVDTRRFDRDGNTNGWRGEGGRKRTLERKKKRNEAKQKKASKKKAKPKKAEATPLAKMAKKAASLKKTKRTAKDAIETEVRHEFYPLSSWSLMISYVCSL